MLQSKPVLTGATREQARERVVELGMDVHDAEGLLNMAVIFGCRTAAGSHGLIHVYHSHRGDSYTVESSTGLIHP